MSEARESVFGRYRLLGEIGRGAMGVVYRARDPMLDRVVALKTMLPGAGLETEARERFLREARSAARLQHAGITTLFDLGEVDGVPFMAMEYLEGMNLLEAVRAGRLETLERKLDVVAQLCRALDYAHSKGVVHRDIKPSNVFMLRDGAVKVLDFGIAWLEGGTFATRTGMLLGTPTYMAPEQFSGGEVDHRVDQWAVGVILFELLAGVRPFEGGTVPQLIYKIVHEPAPILDTVGLGLPDSLATVVARTLQHDPADRYPRLAAMAVVLDAIAAGRSPSQTGSAEIRDAGGDGDPFVDEVPLIPEPTLRMVVTSFHEVATYGEPPSLASLAISPDGRFVAIGSADGTVRLWDLTSGHRLQLLRSRLHLRTGHAALVSHLAYSADGGLLAAGHLDGSIDLWEPATGFELEVRPKHDGVVTGLAFTPDGSTLVSGSHDKTLKLWEVGALVAGEARRRLVRQPAEVTTMVLSADGSQVVSGHTNRVLRVQDVASGRLVASLHGHTAAPSAVDLAPDGDVIASGGRDGWVRLFRLDTKAELRRWEGHQRSVTGIRVLADGRHLASVAQEGAITIWNVAEEDAIVRLPLRQGEAAAALALVPRTGLMVCGLADGRFRIWECS